MTNIRPIVKAAFKCNALAHQYTVIDVEDGEIKATDFDGVVKFVNDEYLDEQIISDAENCLDICNDPCNKTDPDYVREARQLRAFIKRFK